MTTDLSNPSHTEPNKASRLRERFLSERFDEAAGLMYLNALYYDPIIARFVQPDTLDPTEPGVGVNRYAYSQGGPTNRSGLSGEPSRPLASGAKFAFKAYDEYRRSGKLDCQSFKRISLDEIADIA